MLNDIPFDDARDVGSIRYRLHPLDVGFDLRGEGTPVAIEIDGPTLRVSYADRDGDRRVVEGPANVVLKHLRAQGYELEVSRG